MLNLSPNTQKPTVYTNFLLGSRTCFFLFSVTYLGQAKVFGVLGLHFAFHLYSKECLAWHSMAWSLRFCTLHNVLAIGRPGFSNCTLSFVMKRAFFYLSRL
jgi:hypothetical protein